MALGLTGLIGLLVLAALFQVLYDAENGYYDKDKSRNFLETSQEVD